jgi:hypothetical protein
MLMRPLRVKTRTSFTLSEAVTLAILQAGHLIFFGRKFGRNERIRTSDPFVPNEVRYQAAPHSDLLLLMLGVKTVDQVTEPLIVANSQCEGLVAGGWLQQRRVALRPLQTVSRHPVRPLL